MPSLPISQNLVGGVVSGGAGDTSAGMRAGAAQIQTMDWSSVLRPSGQGTHEEKLLQPQVAVENVAFGQAVRTLEIERREHLARKDHTGYVGRVFSNFPDYAVAEQFPFLVPGAFAQPIGNILHEASQDVLAFGCKRVVGIRGDHAVHPKVFRDVSELGDVIAAFGEGERWHEREESP